MSTITTAGALLDRLGVRPVNAGAAHGSWLDTQGPEMVSTNPATGEPIAKVRQALAADYEAVLQAATRRFETWRAVPAPRRGEVIRALGNALREQKDDLGRLVALENGKILSEGLGEVQEMIDICDFAVGLSRQLYGLSMHSERPSHRMYEQWQPLGVVGVISAFNFPVAVWAWNAALAVVCGDPVVWKPSHKVPLAAIAVQNICHRIMQEHDCAGLFGMVMGSVGEVGERMLHDPRVPLISATGSTRMGRRIAEVVGPRMGRTILELGGNNAIVVLDDADLDLAVRAVTFAACGTAGQRCTTTRRLVVQKGVAKDVVERLRKIYASVRIGDPLAPDTLMGPLVDEHAVADYLKAIETAKADGGTVLYGGKKLDRAGHFVEPTIIAARADMKIVHEETFAPILYVIEVKDVDEAIAVNNGVPQGLSSAIFTRDVLAAEKFLSSAGSDCGIANVNIGTSGAEIGGAFGGEKDTGGGREAGSDSWKLYMRRQTVTINYGKELPLAQGVHFDI
jgi:L-aminoadipate-semialdehyde dehydrogenase